MLNQTRKISRLLTITAMCFLLVFLGHASVFAGELQEDIDQAVSILERFQEIPEKSIPPSVLKGSRGLAILTVTKVGFIVSGRGGTGIVISRTEDGWSAPSAIGTGGAGFGFQAGAQVSEFVIVLNTAKAVKAFSKGGNLALGADLSVAAGPVGRSVGADVLPQAAVYTYSRSQGLFAGVSLEGTVIATRDETNAKYYGWKIKPSEILSGNIELPQGAQKLVRILAKY
jgi:lipid-binding SYLF domain-containing protein